MAWEESLIEESATATAETPTQAEATETSAQTTEQTQPTQATTEATAAAEGEAKAEQPSETPKADWREAIKDADPRELRKDPKIAGIVGHILEEERRKAADKVFRDAEREIGRAHV